MSPLSKSDDILCKVVLKNYNLYDKLPIKVNLNLYISEDTTMKVINIISKDIN